MLDASVRYSRGLTLALNMFKMCNRFLESLKYGEITFDCLQKLQMIYRYQQIVNFAIIHSQIGRQLNSSSTLILASLWQCSEGDFIKKKLQKYPCGAMNFGNTVSKGGA